MDVSEKIKSLLKQADVYRAQGLLSESRDMYSQASELIGTLKNLKNKDALLTGLVRKIQAVDADIAKIETASDTPDVGAASQELIKRLFSYTAGKSPDSAALEEAITLTKFGQYDRALADFRSLLTKPGVQLAAAKNIIRCHLTMDTVDAGIAEFKGWVTNSTVGGDQLLKLRTFYQNLIDKKQLNRTLPSVEPEEALGIELEEGATAAEEPEEEILDINSIGLTFGKGPKQGKMIELEVSFQNGNVISVLISRREKDLINQLKPGDRLTQIQFYSPIAIFQGSGLIEGKTEIKVGPRKGDFNVDIKVSST